MRFEKNDSVGKQTEDDACHLTSKPNLKPDNQKMENIAKIFPKKEEGTEECKGSSETNSKDEGTQRKLQTGREHRKRWMKTALPKGGLLAILNNSDLLRRSITHSSIKGVSGENGLQVNIDSVLSCDPSEISEGAVEPIRVGGEKEAEKENGRRGYLELLQHEVRHLREKFELNNRIYQMEDLMRLTVNSKTILNLASIQKYTEYDRKVGESVYQDLECLRLTLERKIGICTFLKVYGKMVNIINDECESSLKSSLENQREGIQTYVVKKVTVAGDSDDMVKNTWRSIVRVLDEQQEYLPDVWELAMSENIYYHL